MNNAILFDVGWDYARCGTGPYDNWPAAARQGHQAATKQKVSRHRPSQYELKWLQVRLSAAVRDIPVSPDFTPNHIQELDCGVCHVTGKRLTYGTKTPTDWSVERVVNEFGYIRGNVVIISRLANEAKGAMTAKEVMKLAQDQKDAFGLTADQWMNFANLMSPFMTSVEQSNMQTILAGGCPVPGMPLPLPAAYQAMLSNAAMGAQPEQAYKRAEKPIPKSMRKNLRRIWRDMLKWRRNGGDAFVFWSLSAPRARYVAWVENIADDTLAKALVHFDAGDIVDLGNGHFDQARRQ